MSVNLARGIVTSFHNRPALIAPTHSDLAADLRDVSVCDGPNERAAWEQRKADMVAAYGFPSVSQERKPFAFSEGNAIIPVHGVLINRFSSSWGFVTGYNFIRQQVAAAAADSDVERIFLDVNSPGGSVAGCTETGAVIAEAAKSKPVLAVADSLMCSAAYWIGSAAGKVYAAPSSWVGSIGVVMMHVSYEEALTKFGVKVTLLHAGAHKVDGHPYADLPDAVRADFQAELDALYADFVGAVAANRNMNTKAVRDTEARVYRAPDALSAGLVDAVVAPSGALAAFLAESDEERDIDMTVQTNTDEAAAAARVAERQRIQAIQGHENAKGREKLAAHLALATDMTVDAAAAILAASPQEAPQAAPPAAPKAGTGNPFKAAMDNGNHPEVGADPSAPGGSGGEGDGTPRRGADATGILAAFQAATGAKIDLTKIKPH